MLTCYGCSKATFVKYAKRGYKIDAQVYATASALLTSIHRRNETMASARLGVNFFQSYINVGKNIQEAFDESKVRFSDDPWNHSLRCVIDFSTWIRIRCYISMEG
jgi:hypothetical protein